MSPLACVKLSVTVSIAPLGTLISYQSSSVLFTTSPLYVPTGMSGLPPHVSFSSHESSEPAARNVEMFGYVSAKRPYWSYVSLPHAEGPQCSWPMRRCESTRKKPEPELPGSVGPFVQLTRKWLPPPHSVVEL